MDKYSIEYLNIVSGSNLWWELATLVTILALGHWLVGRASGFSAGTVGMSKCRRFRECFRVASGLQWREGRDRLASHWGTI